MTAFARDPVQVTLLCYNTGRDRRGEEGRKLVSCIAVAVASFSDSSCVDSVATVVSPVHVWSLIVISLALSIFMDWMIHNCMLYDYHFLKKYCCTC